jgi:asparagine synthase (glutamine-hydrolysing)
MIPLGYWMKGTMLPVIERFLRDSRLVQEGIFRQEPLTQMLEEHVGGRSDHHVRLWMILNTEVWYRMFVHGEAEMSIADQLSQLAESGAPATPTAVGIEPARGTIGRKAMASPWKRSE